MRQHAPQGRHTLTRNFPSRRPKGIQGPIFPFPNVLFSIRIAIAIDGAMKQNMDYIFNFEVNAYFF